MIKIKDIVEEWVGMRDPLFTSIQYCDNHLVVYCTYDAQVFTFQYADPDLYIKLGRALYHIMYEFNSLEW